jgi:hypothetical protein
MPGSQALCFARANVQALLLRPCCQHLLPGLQNVTTGQVVAEVRLWKMALGSLTIRLRAIFTRKARSSRKTMSSRPTKLATSSPLILPVVSHSSPAWLSAHCPPDYASTVRQQNPRD